MPAELELKVEAPCEFRQQDQHAQVEQPEKAKIEKIMRAEDKKDAYTQTYHPNFFNRKAKTKASAAIATFLLHVAKGEQDEAEAMLKLIPGLELASGNVTDLSGRTFENITGFQYAIWALDWHMWSMILKYLPEREAALQLQILEDVGTEYGLRFSFKPLILALNNYVRNYQSWTYEQCEKHWCQQVGGEQLRLPAHAINEYCRPDRPFHPLPSFLEPHLPRTMNTDKGNWFTAEYKGEKLGVKWGVYRYGIRGYAQGGSMMAKGISKAWPGDLRAIYMLEKTRLKQFEELKLNLLKNNSASSVLYLISNARR
ncbi:MAG: hypothetical protein K0R24_913 [Gammaproteobacteria bacterium]|jgi:hypothetical protein|nr:hypothetical protein [Gammaproteobacteria bacterium]